MSFHSVKVLINRNSQKKKEEITVSPQDTLWQTYYNQETRYNELQNQIKLMNEKMQKGQMLEQQKNEKTEILPQPILKQKTNRKTPTIPKTKEEIKIFFHQNYQNIPMIKEEIIKALYQDALDFNQLAKETHHTLEKEQYKQEITDIMELIKWIKDYQIEKENNEPEEIVERPQNHLIYLTSPSGRVLALDELEKESKETYPSFNEALLSIQNGTFKNFKYLHKKLYEVKVKDTRIIFVRINKNTYLLISFFTKNFYSNNKYKEEIYRFSDTIQKEKDKYISLANNQYFLQEQAQITEEIFSLLNRNRGDNYGRNLERKDD